jgi:Zn-finger nucleic acid-binding protein
MNCPKCNGNLAPFGTSEGVELDFCDGCFGILFDQGEVAEYFELAKDIPDLTTDLKLARKTDITCPKCAHGAWLEIPYKPGGDLLIDLCPGCGAVWLDKGEFPKLEKLAAAMSDPKSKLLRAANAVEMKGYQIIGLKKG